MYLLRVFKSEMVKSKHTITRNVPFILAILITFGVLFLTRTSEVKEIFTDSVSIWFNCIAIIMPLMVGLIAGTMGEQEFEAGDFLTMRKSKHRHINFFTKNIYLLGILTIFLFVSMVLLVLGIRVLYKPVEMNMMHLFMSMLVFMAGTLFLVPLGLYISFSFGLGPSIGLGIFGTVCVSYLSSIPLLSEQVWRLIPWAWSVKSVTAYFDHSSLFFSDVDLTLNIEIQLFTFVLLCIGTITWFGKWEGRNI